MDRFQAPDGLVGRGLAEALACRDVLAPAVPPPGRARRLSWWLGSIASQVGAGLCGSIRAVAVRTRHPLRLAVDRVKRAD
jgi:hypothetical protein